MQSNVTLKLEDALLKEARKVAVENDSSLSAWVAELIAETLAQRGNFHAAKARALARMERGFPLTAGRITREELHER